MKNIKKIVIIPAILFLLVGCGKVATLSNGEEKVASLNNGGISANSLYSALKEKYGASQLVDLIDKAIFDEKYKDNEKEEKEYLNEQINQVKDSATQNNISYSQLLAYYGFANESDFKDYMLLTHRREKAVNDFLANDLKDKEIQNYYDEELQGDIKLKHILITADTNENMSDEEKNTAEQKAKKEAEDIISKLNAGEKFDDLAKKHSDDKTNSDNGGDLGWVAIGDMVEEFENAAFKLEKGKYTTTPVKTVYGYHIIYKEDEKDKPKFDDVKNSIKDKLVEEKLNNDSTLYYSTLEKIRKDAGLKFEDDKLKSAYDTYVKNLKQQANSSN